MLLNVCQPLNSNTLFFPLQLGHCVRRGDDKAFAAVETAASLQRVDVNGPDVFGIVLSHLLADLIGRFGSSINLPLCHSSVH